MGARTVVGLACDSGNCTVQAKAAADEKAWEAAPDDKLRLKLRDIKCALLPLVTVAAYQSWLCLCD